MDARIYGIMIWGTVIMWSVAWIYWEMYWAIIIAWTIAISQEIICYKIRHSST